MAQALIASMPPNVDLDLSCQIVFEAVDPTTGSPVSNVTISDALLRVESDASPAQLATGNPILIGINV